MSIIAKHYTGSEFERLKRIYDKAGLKIVNNDETNPTLSKHLLNLKTVYEFNESKFCFNKIVTVSKNYDNR